MGVLEPALSGVLEPALSGVLDPDLSGVLDPGVSGVFEPVPFGVLEPFLSNVLEPGFSETVFGALFSEEFLESSFSGVFERDRSLGTRIFFYFDLALDLSCLNCSQHPPSFGVFCHPELEGALILYPH